MLKHVTSGRANLCCSAPGELGFKKRCSDDEQLATLSDVTSSGIKTSMVGINMKKKFFSLVRKRNTKIAFLLYLSRWIKDNYLLLTLLTTNTIVQVLNIQFTNNRKESENVVLTVETMMHSQHSYFPAPFFLSQNH